MEDEKKKKKEKRKRGEIGGEENSGSVDVETSAKEKKLRKKAQTDEPEEDKAVAPAVTSVKGKKKRNKANSDESGGDMGSSKEQGGDRAIATDSVEANQETKRHKNKNTDEIEYDNAVAADLQENQEKKRRKKRKTVGPEKGKSNSNDPDDKDVVARVDSQDVAGSTSASLTTKSCWQLKKKERKKKNKKKKAELKEKQEAKSNALFPGSNVAEIVGYGMGQVQGKKRSSRKH